MAVATLASRAAGFVRVLVLTAALGLGTRLLDAYNVANTLPNAVYELLIGGAMASVIVPLLTRAALTDPDQGVRYTQRLLSLMVYGLSAITLLALVLAPWLVDLVAPGFTPDQHDMAVVFSRYFLPQILFYGVSATAGAVLNIRGRFAVAAWAPLGNSLVVIAVGLLYVVSGSFTLLAIGTSVGVFAQMALVVWALGRSGFPLRLHLDPRGIAIRRIGGLAGWVLLSVLGAQAFLVAATRVASLSGPGGVTAYQNALAVFQVPFAVIALSVMTTMLPRLSRSAARRDHDRIVRDLSLAVRVAVAVMAPIAVALVLLGRPIAEVLFDHGSSAPATVRSLGTVLAAFGLALVPFSAYSILQRGFYAMQDTRTPALITAGVAVTGIAGCAVAGLVLPAASIVVGVPIAYAIAYTFGLAATVAVLRRRFGWIDGRRLLRTHVRVLSATTAGGIGAFGMTVLLGGAMPLLTIVAAAGVGALAYLGAARLLHIGELRLVLVTTLGGLRAG
ncbi:murein biosynthesis integral membrane protein MurJ [Actinoplanes sp. L3-i22]|uniref:murein biosynthesis integral membrane protein MurJ n=1 Tax=Actinoplanes sp. L3-i22 TaxID=2836373 RepID=UPI001C848042|nr:murein biosynthesis integral membrane protein MurJ [Actinoplanes sp. L3-i22]